MGVEGIPGVEFEDVAVIQSVHCTDLGKYTQLLGHMCDHGGIATVQ